MRLLTLRRDVDVSRRRTRLEEVPDGRGEQTRTGAILREAVFRDSGDLTDGPVDFVGGFQPSDWDPIAQGPLHNKTVTVAKNVLVAHCIWNPAFIETGGLGNAHYVITPGAKTKLTTTEHHGAHPDDWGYSQDLMFNHVMQLIGAQKG